MSFQVGDLRIVLKGDPTMEISLKILSQNWEDKRSRILSGVSRVGFSRVLGGGGGRNLVTDMCLIWPMTFAVKICRSPYSVEGRT